MTWISWSQTWATKRTTTTSRKPLRWRRKHLRWKRMHLVLQADQRLKQNREVLPPLAHLQGLYLFMFEDFALETHVLAFASGSKAKAKHQSPSSWWSTLRRRWSGWTLDSQGLSSERFCAISTLVWWNVEEYNGKRRGKQEKNSILHWSIRIRNSWSPSSSRTFRMQSYWSYSTGQRDYSEQHLRVHISHRMCNQFTFHHNFRIDTGRSNFEQQTDSILHVCG